MAVKLNTDSIADIVTKCTAEKPYRAAVVAKTVKTKKVLDELKEALNANEIGFWCINICYLTYMFRTKNGSTIEVIDNSVYKQDNHVFHDVASEGDGFRIIARRSYY